MAAFDSTQIARLATGLYAVQIGNTTMQWALDSVNGNAYGSVGALANALYTRDFGTMTNAAVASLVVANVGITTAAQVAEATTIVTNALNAAAAGKKGETILGLLNGLATLTTASYAGVVSAYNTQVALAESYAKTAGTKDVSLASLTPVFNLDDSSTIAGFSAMHLTGNQDVRIDFTNPANQVKGLDLNGDGVIAADGVENRITGVASNFKAVDAYPRNPWNQKDTANNFSGDIYFDGTGFKGDGVSTNGNIFLGGFGTDTALGGVGNDFLAGGGTLQGTKGVDSLSGGRNADFFFAELSALDPTDGNKVAIDGGTTADDNSAGVTQSAQDADWLLFEGSDDDEPVTVVLRDDTTFDPIFATPNAQGETGGIYNTETTQTVTWDSFGNPVFTTNTGAAATIDRTGYVITRAGAAVGTLRDIENFDASGNLYGFLNGLDVELGGRATDDRDTAGTSNYGIGSSAQLRIVGSNVGNVIIGGYDNDYIQGADGADLLMGGNLKQFAETVTGGVTNVNLAGIVNDGRDELYGGAGNDNIVFEADGGVIAGDATGANIANVGTGGTDTLWLTKYSTGLQTAADLTTDGVLRFDLTSVNSFVEAGANEGGAGYGGANVTGTADQTNYKTATAPGFSSRVTVTGMDNIDATGLGAIDYFAAGANRPDAVFSNHQNFAGYNGNLNLRGDQSANAIYSGEGDDIIEGRAGNDDLEGNKGKDDFYFALDGDFGNFAGGAASGDGIDVIRRKIDANGDGFWDQNPASTNTQNPSNGSNVWGQDFGLDSDSTTGASVLTIDIQKSGGNPAGTELNQVVNFVSEIVTGVKVGSSFQTITLNTAAIKAATTYTALTAAINTALDATAFGADLQATLSSNGHTITISDAQGRELADQTSEVAGAGVSVNQIANTSTQNTFVYGAPAVTTVQDRIIYKAYEDRSDNEGVDDDTVLGSTISLGSDAYAQDLVISFQKDSSTTFGTGTTTYLAEDQRYDITFDNLTTQDKVTVSVNGVKYTLQVGVALDGTIQGNEDTSTGVAQATIQTNFLTRLADFITNSFTDDDTVAGKVTATSAGNVLTLVQATYNGEQTVFMRTPTVSFEQLSGGQLASATVANASQHEVQLYQFDGRNNKLNTENVKFWGQEEIQRSVLATAKTAGGTLTGLDAVLIDGGTDNLQATVSNSTALIDATQNTIFNNVATNNALSLNFSVHGDDFLLGSDGIDVIKGGTGDDRVVGSIGSSTAPGVSGTDGERLDGGKNYYAVKLLDEALARVYVLNAWESAAANIVSVLPELSGKVISSITLVDQTQTGTGTQSGIFSDTLQYQQEDFSDAKSARFTITLDDYSVSGGVVSLKNDGAGLVSIDANGDGVFESYARFTNFENIRTVSGWGAANASEGQGNDTLNVTALSKDTGGVSYDLTNSGSAGQVRYSADAHSGGAATAAAATATQLATGALRPNNNDFDSLVLRVDGVESVIAGEGDDLLLIDETEAAKNNAFTAGLGDDRIEYQNDFGGGGLTADQAEPMVTINVNTAADTDTVEMTGGRLGTVKATDTLSSVEIITLTTNTAQGTSEADTLNVSNVSTATVDYNDTVRSGTTSGTGVANSGTVRSGAGLELTVENLFEVERVIGATGNDTVKVADAAVMRLNARDDVTNATAAQNIQFMTYLDFDELNTNATTRKSFAAQVTGGTIQQVVNQGEFTFNLSTEGSTTTDVDRLDYSAELGRIIVPVGQGTATAPQYVVVDGDNNLNLSDAESRVDTLYRVEEIVAAQGRSVMDFTAVGQARQITFQYTAPSSSPADKAVLLQTIRIADANGNTISGLNAFIEKWTYDSPTSTLTPVADATWNQIEGSDAAEIVIYQGSEDLVNQTGLDHRYTTDTLTLRGGNNEVRYSPLETSISLSLNVVEENTATTNASEGLITGTVTFQDGKGVNTPSGTFLGGTHTITSYTSDNSTAAGNLKIEGSQDAEDVVSFTTSSTKTFILGTSPGVVNVNIGALNTIVLTGFEFLQDASTSDVYDIRSISSTAGLRLTDNGADHDAIRVANDSVNYNGSGVNTIDLDNISSNVGGFNFEFDVLDLTNLTSAVSGLTVNGGTNAAPVAADADEVADNTDEVVLGALARVSVINDFETMVLTEASVAAGTTFTFSPSGNTLTQGSATITTSADVISFGGLVREDNYNTSAFGTSYVAAATTGVTVNIAGTTGAEVYGGAGADTINGGNAADTIRGAGGNDTLTGGVGTEVRTVQIVGVMDGVAGNTVTLTFTGGGATAVTVTEGVEIATGAGNAAVADALAAKVMAGLTALNTTAAWNGGATLQSVTSAGGILTFTFSPGVDVTGTITTAETDAGATFAISAETVVTNGGNGGADTFVFESTAAKNGADTINNVTLTGGGDVFNFAQFFGAASVLADLNGAGAGVAADFVAAGGALANGQVGVLFNKSGLAASDVQLAAAAGKISLVNNGKAVVIVTADADGVSDTTTNSPYLVYYVQDTDATAAQTYTVTLVGTLNSSTELNAVDWSGANIG